MRYFVFDDEPSATAAVQAINARSRELLAAAGWTVIDGNGVLGKCAGVDNPHAPTVTWDNPRQRLDGKWVVTHPENHPTANLQAGDTAYTVCQYITQDVAAPIEVATPDWWPSDSDAH